MSETFLSPDLRCPRQHGAVSDSGGRRAVFLDRDGVLIPDTGYASDPDRLELLPGVGAAAAKLRTAGFRLVVVTNQSGIARGMFSEGRLHEMHEALRRALAAFQVSLDGIYYCPHHPEAQELRYSLDCDHRKPNPGMLRSAAEALKLDLSSSWLIGDRHGDLLAGKHSGCRVVLVRTGEPVTPEALQLADLVCDDLGEAADAILRTEDAAHTS